MVRVLILLLFLWPVAAFPQTVPLKSTGLKVSLMPAGLRAIMVDSKGSLDIWYFLGRKGKDWVAEVRGAGGVLKRREHYNKDGYLVAIERRDGSMINYIPYFCGDQLGDCTYTVKIPNGRQQTVASHVVQKGTVYTVYLNGKEFASYTLGSYNIRTMQRQGTYWTKVKRIEN